MKDDSGRVVIAGRESQILSGVFNHPVTEVFHHRLVELLRALHFADREINVMKRARPWCSSSLIAVATLTDIQRHSLRETLGVQPVLRQVARDLLTLGLQRTRN